MNINFDPGSQQGKSLFGQLLTLVGALLALALAFMFSLVFFAVLATAGLALWLYFWWTTRALRRQMRDQRAEPMPARDFGRSASESVPASGEVIEGQAVRVIDEGKGE
jgi:hypothetical protein